MTQSTHNYKYLVFSGGGLKGISYCGALKVLEEQQILGPGIKGYAGTSAGSIIAGLLAVGYTSAELSKIMTDLDTRNLFDDKYGYIRDAYNLVEHYGVAPGAYIDSFLGELIEKKTGDADYTIEQLYAEKRIKLVIVGTDMNIKRSRYFHPKALVDSDKKISIRKAIRISMSLPFVFEPVMHDSHLHVDGGVLDNFPIHVFDGKYPGDPKAKLNQLNPNHRVLGLQILTANKLDDILDPDDSPDEITNIVDYGSSFISTFMIENNRRFATSYNEMRTIHIITEKFPLTNFDISLADKNGLIAAGETACRKFFNKVTK